MEKFKKDGIYFNTGIDKDKIILNQYSTTSSIPRNFLIDQNGVVKYVSTGNSEEHVKALAGEIRKLLLK